MAPPIAPKRPSEPIPVNAIIKANSGTARQFFMPNRSRGIDASNTLMAIRRYNADMRAASRPVGVAIYRRCGAGASRSSWTPARAPGRSGCPAGVPALGGIYLRRRATRPFVIGTNAPRSRPDREGLRPRAAEET